MFRVGRILLPSSRLTARFTMRASKFCKIIDCPLASRFSSSLNVYQQKLVIKEPIKYLRNSNLKDNVGARRKRKRIGRGEGGKGKTAGRGHKGFKARQGKTTPFRSFQGGNTGDVFAFPKWRLSRKREHFSKLYLDTLQYWLTSGRLVPKDGVVSAKELLVSGCLRRIAKDGIVLLARGAPHFVHKIHFKVSRASQNAIMCVEKLGGSVSTVYIGSANIKALMQPERVAIPIRDATPHTPKLISRYLDPARRGYLSEIAKTKEQQKELMKMLLEKTKPVDEILKRFKEE
ncbi:YmL10 [Nowakowskiella sp. JEL0078]|nr:YmL10 [Nowakowskiella sp. JEL0078]